MPNLIFLGAFGGVLINICEIKYTASNDYTLGEDEEKKILGRRERFISETHTSKAVHITLITTRGLTLNSYSDISQNVITMDSLFN